ncbi:MAG: hypothetical protein ABFS10_10120 [Bacteroidota bacterium]
MKQVSVVVLLLAALMVTKESSAQVSRFMFWPVEFTESTPGTLPGVPEQLIGGSIAYYGHLSFDKKTGWLQNIHFQTKGGALTGRSGTRYKYRDNLAQGNGINVPPPLEGGEVHYVAHAKVIALGKGKVYSTRVHCIIALDVNGDPYFKKLVLE